jgi:hypothetical protein
MSVFGSRWYLSACLREPGLLSSEPHASWRWYLISCLGPCKAATLAACYVADSAVDLGLQCHTVMATGRTVALQHDVAVNR